MPRLIQYLTEDSRQPRTSYFTTGTNPCGCGSNGYHYEREHHTIYCVCNGCGKDIYTIKPEYAEEEFARGLWRPKNRLVEVI